MTSKAKQILFRTLAAIAVVVALDSVYLLGYRHGMQDAWQQAWAARQGVSYTLVGPTGRAARSVVNTPDPRNYRELGHSSP